MWCQHAELEPVMKKERIIFVNNKVNTSLCSHCTQVPIQHFDTIC